MKKTRWLPFLILALAAGGLSLTVILPSGVSWLGLTLLSVAAGTSVTVKQMGLLRQVTLDDPAQSGNRLGATGPISMRPGPSPFWR